MNSDLSDIATGLSTCLTTDGQSTMTAPIKGFSGSVAAPGYTFSTDLNTGFYRIGPDNIGATVGGTKILDIASTGLSVTGDVSASDDLTVTGDADIGGIVTLTSTDHMKLPNGTTAQRPGSPAAADFRYNSDLGVTEFYNGSAWVAQTPTPVVPQGRLTLTSNTPVLSTDTTAATTVYYTPYTGAIVPIYNGSAFQNTTFSEISCGLVAAHAANTIYDFFIINDSGTVRLVTGPAWSVSTAGSGARGTGAGTTQLARVSGIWTNAVSMTGRYGSTTVAVSANQGTYVGSMSMDGTNGQVSCYVSWGQSRKWGVWNAYNRVPIAMLAGDSTANWTYTSTTPRPANNSAANSISAFCGLAEEAIEAELKQNISVNTNLAACTVGVGVNVTNAFSGVTARLNKSNDSGPISLLFPCSAHRAVPPSLGITTVTMLEAGSAVSVGFIGTQADMQMEVNYRG